MLEEITNFLQNRQVYITKNIVNRSFQTIAEAGKVYNIGAVHIKKTVSDYSDNNSIAFTIVIDDVETTIYYFLSENEFLKYIKVFFIPVSEMFEIYKHHHFWH